MVCPSTTDILWISLKQLPKLNQLEHVVILIVRSFVYRELTRQVTIVAVISRRCQVYPDACLPNAMSEHDEGILVLSDNR